MLGTYDIEETSGFLPRNFIAANLDRKHKRAFGEDSFYYRNSA